MTKAETDALPETTLGPGAKIGKENRERVRQYFLDHVGCTNLECSVALGLSTMSVGRHVHRLRREWLERKDRPPQDYPRHLRLATQDEVILIGKAVIDAMWQTGEDIRPAIRSALDKVFAARFDDEDCAP